MTPYEQMAETLAGSDSESIGAALNSAYNDGLEAAARLADAQAAEAAVWVGEAGSNTEMQLHTATRLRAELRAQTIRALRV